MTTIKEPTRRDSPFWSDFGLEEVVAPGFEGLLYASAHAHCLRKATVREFLSGIHQSFWHLFDELAKGFERRSRSQADTSSSCN